MKRTSLMLLLAIGAVATLIMISVLPGTNALTSNAERDSADPFVSQSEFETSFSQAPCDLCKGLCDGPNPTQCQQFSGPQCKCKTCDGQFNCWD